jgi:hypothetical protein
MSIIPATWAKLGRSQSKAGPGQKHKTLSAKQTKAKRVGGVRGRSTHLASTKS